MDLLAVGGNVAGAIAVLERAASISPETPLDRALVTRLEKYRMGLITPSTEPR
jgi:hypothetical protein